MFYVQFKTQGKNGIQTIAIKKYKLAKKAFEILVKSEQIDVRLMDYDGETLLREDKPNEVCPNKTAHIKADH